jgi:N-acetylglucosamine-6-phosphate deacetylase
MMLSMNAPVVLSAARLITPEDELSPGWVRIENGRIGDVGQGTPSPTDDVQDLGDVTLAPGFIDLHVHGGGGHSLTTENPREIEAYAAWAPSTGVTSFLATVVASDVDEGLRFARAIGEARPDRGANLLGVNLEGPFLNPERNGAIPRSWIVPPDQQTFGRLHDACTGSLRLMTIAPEIDGAAAVAEAALTGGVAISVGHTDATFAIASEAFRRGSRHVTHAFNAMRPFHHREPGPLGAALESEGVTVEVIADGVHVHPAAVRWLVSAFGPSRVAIVTDGTPLAGRGDGSFKIAGAEATVREGRSALADGTIAGSVATMDQLIRNIVNWGVCSLPDAIRMASAVPAKVAGFSERKAVIVTGYDADLVALGSDLRPTCSWVAGEPVYHVKKR